MKLSDSESAFRWVITGRGVGAVIPMGVITYCSSSNTARVHCKFESYNTLAES